MRSWMIAAVCLLGFGSCGGDDGDGSGGADAAAATLCERGCQATLAADCPQGPSDQSTCVADCVQLESGSCAIEYRALQLCADGEAVTCDTNVGIPVVAACSSEQSDFINCINGL